MFNYNVSTKPGKHGYLLTQVSFKSQKKTHCVFDDKNNLKPYNLSNLKLRCVEEIRVCSIR